MLTYTDYRNCFPICAIQIMGIVSQYVQGPIPKCGSIGSISCMAFQTLSILVNYSELSSSSVSFLLADYSEPSSSGVSFKTIVEL